MSRDTRDKLNSIGLICEELYPDDSTNLEKLLSDIDNGKSTLNKVYNKVKYLHNKSKYNKKVEGGDYKKNSVTIYNKSSETMEELDDESVNVCLGSPVYWKMKVYQLPSNQL
jgi:hypothetical protein